MKATTDKTAGRSEVYTLLGTIRMSEEDRSRAYTNLHNGELIAELVLRAAADMRAIVQIVERAAAGAVRACKAIFLRAQEIPAFAKRKRLLFRW